MFPKLIAFETSGVLFLGSLRDELWGKGSGASSKLADNVKKVDSWLLKDKSNNQNTVTLCPDTPRIIEDVLKNGASIALVSSHDSKELTNRVLYYFCATDPRDSEQKSIIKMIRYNQVGNESKTKHFERIHGWCKYAYEDMVYFDNAVACDLSKEGVLVRPIDQGGLTWEKYQQGIEVWRAGHDDKPVAPPPAGKKNVLKIAHFNDVYQVSNQKLKINGKEENIDVMKFATLLTNVKKKWAADGIQDGLTVFSGDTFSPSFQSSITRGRHMAAVMNALHVDISVAGNHEFDFGYRRLAELIGDTNFPWLLSNIIDTNTGAVPEPMKAFHVIEKAGVRIGFIGLVEKQWIATITGWPDNFEWEDMAVVGKKLSKVLRESPHNCDLVFALTHSRIPNDIKLAEELHALAPSARHGSDIASEHGVDLLLGGHDHIYWISKGLGSWDGYDINQSLLDAASDKGNTLIVKSGTDFQELSEVTLTLKDTPTGSVRKKLIESISGIRHATTGDLAIDPEMKKVIDLELAEINAAMADPICISKVELDARSLVIRTGESAVGNWVADCLKPVYNEVLEKLGYPAVDCVIICMGDIRGDSTYAKGPITLGDLMQMLPFPDPMVVVEMDGEALWTAMESGLSRWPVQEGRFPAISGFRVEWRTSKKPGQRIEKMWLREETKEVGSDGKPKLIDKEEIKRNRDRKYIVAVGEYMTQGGDGYTVLKEQKLILNGENGQSKSTLIRKFLLGAHFVNKVSHDPEAKPKDLLPETFNFVSKARTTFNLPQLDTSIISMPKIPKVKMPKIPNMHLPDMPNVPNVPNMPNMPSMPSMPNVPKVPGISSVSELSGKITSPNIPGFLPKPRNSSPFSPGPSASSDPEPLSGSGSSWNSGDSSESSWSLPSIPGVFSSKSSYASKVVGAASRSAQSVSGSVSKATSAASNAASKATDAASNAASKAADAASKAADAASKAADAASDRVRALQDASLDLAEAIQQTVIASCMWITSTALQTFALRVAENEDLSIVDGYERHRMGIQIEGSFSIQIVKRNEKSAASDNTVREQTKEVKVEKDLPVISPVIDGRLKDLDGKAGKV